MGPPPPRRWRPGPRQAAAALSGILAAQAFPPLDLGWLGWLALAPLLAALQGVRPRRGFGLGFLHGMAFYLLLLPWIPDVVGHYGGLGPAVGWSVGLLLMAVLSAFHGLFGCTLAWLGLRRSGLTLVTAPAAWVLLAEWLRTWPVGGFPWGVLGYTQYRFPGALRLAPWIGVWGLSLLQVAAAALLVGLLSPVSPVRRRLASVLGLAALTLALAVSALAPSRDLGGEPALTVAAVQGNVLQDEKWQSERREEILERHLGLTARAVGMGARLILWPESSTLEQLADSPETARRLRQILAAGGAQALVGSVYHLPEGGYANSAFLVDPRLGLVERYDKRRLVPFGETVPLAELLFFVRPLVQAVGDFRPGQTVGVLGGRQPPSEDAGDPVPPFGVAICYEIIYPHLVTAQVREGATFLTTITNDAWFGLSGAPGQHFAMAVLRAAESRRWLVRAANTGISGIVGPEGRVRSASALFVPALITGQIRPRLDLTFFVRHPHAVPLACVMIFALAVAVAARRSPERP